MPAGQSPGCWPPRVLPVRRDPDRGLPRQHPVGGGRAYRLPHGSPGAAISHRRVSFNRRAITGFALRTTSMLVLVSVSASWVFRLDRRHPREPRCFAPSSRATLPDLSPLTGSWSTYVDQGCAPARLCCCLRQLWCSACPPPPYSLEAGRRVRRSRAAPSCWCCSQSCCASLRLCSCWRSCRSDRYVAAKRSYQ